MILDLWYVLLYSRLSFQLPLELQDLNRMEGGGGGVLVADGGRSTAHSSRERGTAVSSRDSLDVNSWSKCSLPNFDDLIYTCELRGHSLLLTWLLIHGEIEIATAARNQPEQPCPQATHRLLPTESPASHASRPLPRLRSPRTSSGPNPLLGWCPSPSIPE